MARKFPLRIELVPEPLWGQNLALKSGWPRSYAICTVCHSIQHWGRTKMLIAGGLMSIADGRRLIRHFMKVNHCAGGIR